MQKDTSSQNQTDDLNNRALPHRVDTGEPLTDVPREPLVSHRPVRKPVRLGWGEFEPSGGALSTADARARFLVAVRRIVPQVLADLAGHPPEIFKMTEAEVDVSNYRSWPALTVAADDVPAARELREAVLTWSRRYHLNAEWCLERALQTLRAWHRLPADSRLRSEWDHEAVTIFLPVSVDQRRFTFTHPGWELTTDNVTRAELERVVRAAFEAHLSDYLDSMETLAHAAGMERTPQKRRLDHFDWLVYYQVERWSHQEIAEEAGVDRTTVRDGLKTTAREIGLRLRPVGRAGRPRKPIT